MNKEAVNDLNELGEKYCTSAKVVDEGIEIELTKEQRDNLIKRNNEFKEKLIKNYKDLGYTYKGDNGKENYTKLEFYYDENLGPLEEMKVVSSSVSEYGLNQILLTNNPDWKVNVKIINCHNGKEVISFQIPTEEVISWSVEDWENSYK